MTTVVKVGGSLFDWPGLGPRLRSYLARIEQPVLVPGGGMAANAVRAFDRLHHLGAEASHWLALRAMTFNSQLLRCLVDAKTEIVDAYDFCRTDEANEDHLPHSWSVTADAVAARVAEVRAATLVLLKSTDPPGPTPKEWKQADYVDEWLPMIVLRGGLPVTCINLRTYKDPK